MASWGEFEDEVPDLAAFGAARITALPAYLASLRVGGIPRVHPVTAIIGERRLFVFMEPTSPKGRDLRERRWYALHTSVPDMFGSGGEFFIYGEAALVEDPQSRGAAVRAASYDPEDRYVLFELGVHEACCNGYGAEPLPSIRRWVSPVT